MWDFGPLLDEFFSKPLGVHERIAQGYPDVTNGPNGLRNNDNLGRLTVTNVNGAKELDTDTEFERLSVPGGRSFSIRRANGTLVYDSGDELE